MTPFYITKYNQTLKKYYILKKLMVAKALLGVRLVTDPNQKSPPQTFITYT